MEQTMPTQAPSYLAVYTVRGWHWSIPANPFSIWKTEELANDEAAMLLRIMVEDADREFDLHNKSKAFRVINGDNWKTKLAELRKWLASQDNTIDEEMSLGIEVEPHEVRE
jgi:hypothetical protein